MVSFHAFGGFLVVLAAVAHTQRHVAVQIQVQPHQNIVEYTVHGHVLQHQFHLLEQFQLHPQRGVHHVQAAFQQGFPGEVAGELVAAVHAFEQHGPVEFIGVFEGEFAADGGGPAAGGFFQQGLQEGAAAFLLVGVLALPGQERGYMMLRMRGQERVPLRSWEREASGQTMVCLNHEAICPQTNELGYFLRLRSLRSLECPLSPVISLTATVIQSASKEAYSLGEKQVWVKAQKKTISERSSWLKSVLPRKSSWWLTTRQQRRNSSSLSPRWVSRMSRMCLKKCSIVRAGASVLYFISCYCSSFSTLSWRSTRTWAVRGGAYRWMGGCWLASLLEKKNLSLSSEVIRFWKRMFIRSCRLMSEQSCRFFYFYSSGSLRSQGQALRQLSIRNWRQTSPSSSMKASTWAIQRTSHAGMPSRKPSLMFLSAQSSSSLGVTWPSLLSMVELRVKKQFLWSMRLLKVLELDSCRQLPLQRSLPQRQMELTCSQLDSVMEQQSKVSSSPYSMSRKQYIPMKYLPYETVMMVPQLGSQECEKRLEKLPLRLGSTTSMSQPRGQSLCFSRQMLQNSGMQFLSFFFFMISLMKSYRSYHRHGSQIYPKYYTMNSPCWMPALSTQIAPFPFVWMRKPYLSRAQVQLRQRMSAQRQSRGVKRARGSAGGSAGWKHQTPWVWGGQSGAQSAWALMNWQVSTRLQPFSPRKFMALARVFYMKSDLRARLSTFQAKPWMSKRGRQWKMMLRVKRSMPQVSFSSICSGWSSDAVFLPTHFFRSCFLISLLRQRRCLSLSACSHSTFLALLGHSVSHPLARLNLQNHLSSPSSSAIQTQSSGHSTGYLRLWSRCAMWATLCGGVGTQWSISSYSRKEVGMMGQLGRLTLQLVSYLVRRARSACFTSSNLVWISLLPRKAATCSQTWERWAKERAEAARQTWFQLRRRFTSVWQSDSCTQRPA